MSCTAWFFFSFFKRYCRVWWDKQSFRRAIDVNNAIESDRVAVVAPYIMGVLLYFAIFYSACMAEWMVWTRMARQVNRLLPTSEQFPTSRWALSPRYAHAPTNQFKIWKLHRQFYPESNLRLLMLATLALMVLFFGLTVFADRQAVSHRPLPQSTVLLRARPINGGDDHDSRQFWLSVKRGGDYSSPKARIGSTLIARRAGT